MSTNNIIIDHNYSSKGTCKKCGRDTDVRYLKAYPKIGFNLQRYTAIGPFDRYCAYREKYQKVPVFYTQPNGLFEGIYRYITRLEIPYDRNRSWKMIYNIILKLGSSLSQLLLSLMIISISMFIFVPIMIFMSPFLFLLIFYLPFLIPLIIRYVRMFTKNSGLTKSSNFEKFWNGKLNKQDLQLNYYIRKIIVIAPVLLVFRWILSLENNIMSYVDQHDTPLSLLFPDLSSSFSYIESIGITPYKLIVGIIFYFVFGMLGSSRTISSWDRYTAMPKDVHQIALERKREELVKRDEKSSITQPSKRLSRNPLALFTRLFLPTQKEGVDFICQICKTQVDENTLEVYCENCSRYFHKNHITTHLNELEKNNKDPVCPVCYFDAKVVFSEIEW